MLTDVVEAEAREGLRVFLRFEDGLSGEVGLGDHLVFEGVFASLRDQARFAELEVNKALGTICWPNGADLAPETLRTWLKEAIQPLTAWPTKNNPGDMPKAEDAPGATKPE